MKIIKTSSTQITPEQGQIENARQESSVNTYSCNYVNEALDNIDTKHTYSTTEHIVGKYIDNKPIYEKTISTGSLSNGGSHNVGNIPNLDNIISIKGAGYYSAGGVWFPIGSEASNSYLFAEIRNNNINIRVGQIAMAKANITIEYTKTTD